MLEAENSTTGLRVFEQERPDLVILGLDISDSLIVLAKVKESSPETPVIIMVEKSRQEQIAQALQSGAWDYLFKPLHHDPSVFLHTIGRNLEHAGLIRKNTEYMLNLERVVRENQELQRAKNDTAPSLKKGSAGAGGPLSQSGGQYTRGNLQMQPREKTGSSSWPIRQWLPCSGMLPSRNLMQTRPDDLYTSRTRSSGTACQALPSMGRLSSSELLIKKK